MAAAAGLGMMYGPTYGMAVPKEDLEFFGKCIGHQYQCRYPVGIIFIVITTVAGTRYYVSRYQYYL